MNFNKHSELEGKHAVLGASQHSWLNYSDEKMAVTYKNKLATEKGTRLHAFASEAIYLRQKQPSSKKTLNMYVNDAIGFRMIPEVILFYSYNSFGTADAISFKNNFLRIHDLKTGVTPASFSQLYIYVALFCLEYKVSPENIQIELRIYQLDERHVDVPDPKDIRTIMGKIISFDKILDSVRDEVYS